MDLWTVPTLGLLCKCCLSIDYMSLFGQRLSLLSYRVLGAELQYYRGSLCLTFLETTQLFSIVAVPFTFISVEGFQFLYILNNTYLSYFIITIIVGMKWNLTMILICISLIANDVQHLYLCLLVIYVSYLEKCLFISFDHLLIGLFVFFSCQSF